MRVFPISNQNNSNKQSFKSLNVLLPKDSRILKDPAIKAGIESFAKDLENTTRFDLNILPLEGSKDKVRYLWTEKETGKPFMDCAYNANASGLHANLIILKPLGPKAGFKSLELSYDPYMREGFAKNLTADRALYIMKGFTREQANELIARGSSFSRHFKTAMNNFIESRTGSFMETLERKVQQTLTLDSAREFKINK